MIKNQPAQMIDNKDGNHNLITIERSTIHAIVASIIAFLIFSSCILFLTFNSELTSSFQEGQEAGKEIGYTLGIEEGLRQSGVVYDQAYLEGYNDAKKEYLKSNKENFDKGYEAGIRVSNIKEYNAGYEAGKEEADQGQYDAGYEAGKAEADQGQYNAGYEAGKAEADQGQYNAGYEAGKATANSLTSSSFSSNSTNSEAATTNTEVVYVSNYGKIHRRSNCSGMKYYTEMTMSQALANGYVKCKKCY